MAATPPQSGEERHGEHAAAALRHLRLAVAHLLAAGEDEIALKVDHALERLSVPSDEGLAERS